LESIRRLWGEMDPRLFASSQPTLRSMDDGRAELSWQGQPFLFDTNGRTILRAGRAIATYDAVRSIGISERRDENHGTSWRVTLETGFLRGVLVGSTSDQADASIAAAHLATVLGKQVQVL
jgi:acyl-coenzyme A thioesterase PaaI-like protein